MQKLFFLFSLSAFLFAQAHVVNPEGRPDVCIHTEGIASDAAASFGHYALILTNMALPDILYIISHICGYGLQCINPPDNDSLHIRSMLNDSINKWGLPSCIIIIAAYESISPFKSWENPYTGNVFYSDNYYGVHEACRAGIPVARIPLSSAEKLASYLHNALNYMSSFSVQAYNGMAPFYDIDDDGYEDYLYSSLVYDAMDLFSSSVPVHALYESSSTYPQYFCSGSRVPDSLRKPAYDWQADYNDIKQAFTASSFSIYRGHGNAFSTVSPYFPSVYLDSLQMHPFSMFAGFACLLGDNKGNTSFADSLFNTGCLAVTASSSETFYQYNNWMCRFFLDCLNDNVVSEVHSDPENGFGMMLYNAKNKLLACFGLNDYTECQIRSYSILGLPFLGPKASLHTLELYSGIAYSGDSIYVYASEQCTCLLSSVQGIEEEMYLEAGINRICLNSSRPGRMHYISCYKSGHLALDSVFIEQRPVMKLPGEPADQEETISCKKSIKMFNILGARVSGTVQGIFFCEGYKIVNAGRFIISPH